MAGKETEKKGQNKPYLIDFLRLKEDEYITIDKIRLSRPNRKFSVGLEINKILPGSHSFIYMIVDQKLLDNARDWMLSQPPAKELTEAETRNLYEIARNLDQMYLEIKK